MTKIIRKTAFFRPFKKPTIQIPYGVRSVGEHYVKNGWCDEEKTTHYIKLLWGIEGKGEIIIKDQKYIIKPQSILILYPNNMDNAIAITSEWRVRWLTLDGTMNLDIVKSLNLQEGLKNSIPCPEHLFVKLEREIKNPTPTGQLNAISTAFSILTNAIEKPIPKNKRFDILIRNIIIFIKKNFSNPEVNINYLANYFNINRSTLSREFYKRQGISLINFLISIRTQEALSLLKRTDLSISEIAYMTGYDDADYFSKSIKKQIGSTPTQCRKL